MLHLGQQPLEKPGGPVEGIRLCRKCSRGKRNTVSLFLPPQGDLAGISPTPSQHCQKRACGSQRVKVSGGWCSLEGGDVPQACGEHRDGEQLSILSETSQGLEGSPSHRKPSPASSPSPELGRGTRNYTQLRSPTSSVEGGRSSPASHGVPITSTLITSVV